MEPTAKNKKGLLFTIFCLAAALIAAAANFLLLYFYSDQTDVDGVYQTVLYKSGAPATVYFVVLVVIVAALASSAIFFRRTAPPETDKERAPMMFIRAAAGTIPVCLIAMQFILKTEGTPYTFNSNAFSVQNPSSMQKVALVLAIFGTIGFLLPLFVRKKSKVLTVLRVVCGLLFVFFLCAELLVTHEFYSDFLYSPTRLYAICSYCFLIFFFLTEIRMQIAERLLPGAFVATGLIAFFLTVVEALPKLTLSFMGAAGYRVGLDSFYVLARLVFGIYALIAVYPVLRSTKQLPKAEKAKEAKMIEKADDEKPAEEQQETTEQPQTVDEPTECVEEPVETQESENSERGERDAE